MEQELPADVLGDQSWGDINNGYDKMRNNETN